jgi:FkbH-like protein
MNKSKEIKCVVWDLDDTLWNGILLENDSVRLKPGIKKIIQTLDSRGILHSIASKNDYELSMKTLKKFNLHEYFLYPQIGWNAKSLSVKNIQKALNIAMNSMMFIDDQPFEQDEVRYVHPEVICIDASAYNKLPSHPGLNPKFRTEDARKRRMMYQEDIRRKDYEQTFQGPKKEFLASLRLELIISEAKEEDLVRAEELTARTNQLNTTGIRYHYNELRNYLNSDKHKLLVCELKDKYGEYGKIGLALIETSEDYWHLKLLLMSCRVMSLGIGTVLLSHIMQRAKEAGKKLTADFKRTERNRMMYISFKFANFTEIKSYHNGITCLKNDLSMIQEIPSYIDLLIC